MELRHQTQRKDKLIPLFIYSALVLVCLSLQGQENRPPLVANNVMRRRLRGNANLSSRPYNSNG